MVDSDFASLNWLLYIIIYSEIALRDANNVYLGLVLLRIWDFHHYRNGNEMNIWK